MSGIEQLNECVALVLSKLEGIEKRLGVVSKAESMDETALLTARELCERWNLDYKSGIALHSLARLCRQRHLKPLIGARGWDAQYRVVDVLRAESFAAGGAGR